MRMKFMFFAMFFCLMLTSCSQKSETIMDTDGNVYTTVQIGNQIWTVENWRSTKYNDGSAIPLETDNSKWLNPNFTTSAYGSINMEKYGLLYNWHVVDPSNPKQIAPEGWRVPTDADWSALAAYLGGSEVAGGKMKMKGTSYWAPPNSGATNASGFSALPGGCFNIDGVFFYKGSLGGRWWSTTEYDSIKAWNRGLLHDHADLRRAGSCMGSLKSSALSLRLVRDLVRPE